MIAGRRKIIKIGSGHAFTIPANFVKGREVTFAGLDLILIDPTGKKSTGELATLLEKLEAKK